MLFDGMDIGEAHAHRCIITGILILHRNLCFAKLVVNESGVNRYEDQTINQKDLPCYCLSIWATAFFLSFA